MFSGPFDFYYRAAANVPLVFLISAVIGIASGILLMIFFLPKKNRERFVNRRGLLFFFDFLNFKYMAIGIISKVLYVMLTFAFIVTGLYVLFIQPLTGLIILTLGNVLLRMFYELIMILFSIHENLNFLTNHVTGREDAVITNEDIAGAFKARRAQPNYYGTPPQYPGYPPQYPQQPQYPQKPQYPQQPLEYPQQPLDPVPAPPVEPPLSGSQDEPEAAVQDEDQPDFECPACKNPLRAGAKFCNKCGAKISG